MELSSALLPSIPSIHTIQQRITYEMLSFHYKSFHIGQSQSRAVGPVLQIDTTMVNNSSRLQAQEQLQQQTTPAASAKPHKLISMKRRKPSNGNSSPAVDNSGALPPVSNRTSENTIPAKCPANEVEDESETQNKKPRFRESEQHATPSYGIEVAEDGRYIASGAPLKRSRGRSVE